MPVEAKCTQSGEGWAEFCSAAMSGVLCSPYLWGALAAAFSTDLSLHMAKRWPSVCQLLSELVSDCLGASPTACSSIF